MIYIHGSGHFHPENIIDNQFLEELDIGTDKEWILDRVGIHKRRTVLPLSYIKDTKNKDPRVANEVALYSNAQTGAKAAQMAIDRAGLTKDAIGLVISGSCTPQYSCPAEACTIACELEIRAPSFDLNSACSSMAAQLNFINWMDPTKLPEYILLVNPENSTRSIDYSDRTSAVLWGDGSSALVLSTKVPSRMTVSHSVFESAPANWDKVVFPTGGLFRQEGRTVQSFAIKSSIALIRQLSSVLSPEKQLKSKYIGHQANLLMLESICRTAKIEPERHFFNVDQFGNCGAAGAPSVLSQNWDNLVDGNVLMVAVVGAGLSWGGVNIEVGPS